jgi:hypothetical protein
MTEEKQSPLAEANPDSIQDLFNKSPEELTDWDLESLVTALRAQRARWLQMEQTKANKEKKERVPLSQHEVDDLLKDL